MKEKLIFILITASCIAGYIRIGFCWNPPRDVKLKEFVEDNIELLSQGNIITSNLVEEWGIWPYLHQRGIRTYSMYTGLDEMSLEHIRLNYAKIYAPSYDKIVSLLKKDKLNLLIITEETLRHYNTYHL